MSSLSELLNTAVAECWCDTKRGVKTFEYEWTIHNYMHRSEQCGQYVESPLFPEGAARGQPKWSVRVYPKGRNASCFHYLQFDVVSHVIWKVRANFKFTLSNYDGEKLFSYETPTYIFTEHKRYVPIKQYVRLSHLGRTKPYDLVVLCEVSVANDIWNISDKPRSKLEVPEKTLSEDFGTLLDNEKFSDVKLVAGGHGLNAHKNILAVRSKVFATMFENDMKEQNMNRVTITDIDHEVLKEMLRYMYTGKAPNLDTMAGDLFVAADKYDIRNLKLMCEESLLHNISIEKAVNTLVLAERHNAEQLKSQTIIFIIRNATSVMETQGWKDIKTTRPHLFEELFREVAHQLKNNT